ncbi:class II histone deacetylase [Crenobacter sp. SG2305]|uniref:class II histone deacetylase n=1 Tax=Crenobacter oryzisoli TaxID=3056844 RepID=UPI0025AAE9AB|nr:class II histone deacetylase [Crenobacter sp. SG2305]MDN0084759.1 class II histone deacetylase [Crenobacter sp. SG2305]
MTKTGFIYDERFLEHSAGRQIYAGADCGEEFDSPLRLVHTKRLLDALEITPRLTPLGFTAASDQQLLRAHSADYLASLAARCTAAGETIIQLGDDARGGSATERTARLAAGAACAAVDAVLQGQVDNVYALIRPSGHHASRDFSMGYCYYNNAVVAARHAQAVYGLERVAIIDWDVHHGNGSQALCYDDPSVLFVSLHEEDNYPQDGGASDEAGEGAGLGYNLNLPLPAGTGNKGYLAAFDEIVLPVLHHYRPQLILISAGQDANAYDPLGRMRLTRDGYTALAARLKTLAEQVCDGRLVALQEGGYSLPYLPIATLGVIEGLSGQVSDFVDPHHFPARSIAPQERTALDALRQSHARYWPTLTE